MQIESMHDLFVFELQGAYHMEKQLVETLDEMALKATNDRISQGFADHRDETERHVERIEEVFDVIKRPSEERPCPVVEALDEDRRTVEENVQDQELLNLFYLGAGMKTERIELTTYDSLLTLADRVDLGDEVKAPLRQNRESEEDTLDQLQTLSTTSDLKQLWQRLTP